MTPSDDQQKLREEQKRDTAWDPVARWRALQEAMTLACSLPHIRRNTPQRCLELQSSKLHRFAQSQD